MIVSDAVVVVPGGIGTLLELTIAWQLLQVRKLDDVPLILVGEMWADLLAWARAAMLRADAPLADAADFAIPHCVRTLDETVALIRACRAARAAAERRSEIPATSRVLLKLALTRTQDPKAIQVYFDTY